MLKFFILNRLKVTKFFVKTSKFKFLVKTDKTFFVYRLFLLLNISDFSLPSRHESNSKETLWNSPPPKIYVLSQASVIQFRSSSPRYFLKHR